MPYHQTTPDPLAVASRPFARQRFSREMLMSAPDWITQGPDATRLDSATEIKRKNARDIAIALVALPIIAMALTFTLRMLM